MSNAGLVALLVAAAPTALQAQAAFEPLTRTSVELQLFGRSVTGEYQNGQTWAERFNRDGTSDYVQDGVLTRGRMHFEGNVLCFTYPPQEMSGGCFEVWQRGANCFDFYSVGAGSVPATIRQKRFGEAWDARAWIDGVPSTCKTELIS